MISSRLTPSLVLLFCWVIGSPAWAENGPPGVPVSDPIRTEVSSVKSFSPLSAALSLLGGAITPNSGAPNAAGVPAPGLTTGCRASGGWYSPFLGLPALAHRDEACLAPEAGKQSVAAPVKVSRPIRIYQNETVRIYIRGYLEKNHRALERGLERSRQYLGMIQTIFAQEGIPPELAYLAAVESNFNHRARSSASAMGMWQFMYFTGRKFGLRIHYPWYDERLDPKRSTRAAARLLAYLHDIYGSWELALAAYNAGEGRVNKALREARAQGRKTDYWNLDLPDQTREYVPAFMASVLLYRSMGAKGPAPTAPKPPQVTDTLEVDFSTSLAEVAHRLNLPLPEMVRLNPAWRRGFIPPKLEGGATLRLPLGMRGALLTSLKSAPKKPIPWLTHTVEVGETLAHIARGYGLSISAIVAVNPIPNRHFLAIGQRLIIPLPPGGRPQASRGGKGSPSASEEKPPAVGAHTPGVPVATRPAIKPDTALVAER